MSEPYFTLCSGRPFRFMSPSEDDIHLDDIAHSLSHLCRFNGHSKVHYSVATHSIYCSFLVSEEHAFQALMHDATEAYVGDMISPLKSLIPDFKNFEERIWSVICAKYDIPVDLVPEVHEADRAMLLAEARDLLPPFGEPKFPELSTVDPADFCVWKEGGPPVDQETSKALFLIRAAQLRPDITELRELVVI